MNPFRDRLRDLRRNASGFTLVELQIAIVLLAMISVLLTGALRATLFAWDRSAQHQDEAEHQFLTDQFLRRHLGNMRFPRFETSDGKRHLSFAGDGQTVHFVAPYPGYRNDGELYWWTIKNAASDVNGRYDLILEYSEFDPDIVINYRSTDAFFQERPDLKTIMIAESTQIASVEYLGLSDTRRKRWLDRWEPGNQAPQALRLRLHSTASDGGKHEWPEIALSPRTRR